MTASVQLTRRPTPTLRIPEIAARMGITVSSLYSAIYRQTHALPAMELPPLIKIGNKWAISPEDLDTWLNARRASSPLRGQHVNFRRG